MFFTKDSLLELAMRSNNGKKHIAIITKIVRQDDKPVAVVLDYRESLRLKEIEEDELDYQAAGRTKAKNRKWVAHEDLKKEFGL
jgi:hypothetical protein